MKLEHTPGPWTICSVGPNAEKIGVQTPYNVICIVDSWAADGNREQNTNDARLIAAAPEMLEALIEFYKSDGYNELAKTAIEKATGMKIEDVLK